MTTSRTGTAQWKRVRKAALKRAQAEGITSCPWCGVLLNYDQGLLPNSAEPDHVVAWAHGGEDSVDNTSVCCRRCNQSKGNRAAPKLSTVQATKPLKVSRQW